MGILKEKQKECQMDLSAKMARKIGLLYLRFLPWIFVEKCGKWWGQLFDGKKV